MKQQATSTRRFRGAPVDLVVDIRSKIEYWLGHLPGAVCLPPEQLLEGLAGRSDVSTSSRLLVYCGSGVRSAAAVSQLREAGYTNVVDGGGLSAAWEHFKP